MPRGFISGPAWTAGSGGLQEMVKKKKPIDHLVKTIGKIRDRRIKAHNLAMIELGEIAKLQAVQNVREEFGHRVPGRRQTGQLMNSVFTRREKVTGTKLLMIWLGTRRIPYGRIHELGGVVKPVQARWLWLKQYQKVPAKFRRMTPREFIENKRKRPDEFQIFEDNSGGLTAWYKGPSKYAQGARKRGKPRIRIARWIPLFFLRKQVKIPKRPYLVPAAEFAIKQYRKVMNKHLNALMRGS